MLTMGSTRLWLPSRRSVDSHRGGLSMVLLGHDRSGRFRGLKALYFFQGSASIGMLADSCEDGPRLAEEGNEYVRLGKCASGTDRRGIYRSKNV